MRREKIILLLLPSIILLITLGQRVLSAGACDEGIIVTGTASCQTETVAESQSILDLAAAVQARISHHYADSRNTILMGSLEPELRRAVEGTVARLILYRADSLTSLPLAYPGEMINDQTQPEFDRTPSSKQNKDGSITVAWTANEFVMGILRYGTTSGAATYTEEAIQLQFGKRNEVTTAANLSAGTLYYGQIEMFDLSGNATKSEEFTFGARTGTPLVLIYAGMDNNLGEEVDNLSRLIENIEKGTHAGINVRFFLDGPGEDDSYIYAVPPNAVGNIKPRDLACNGIYVEGTNCWTGDEDSAHPFALYTFIKDAIEAHRAEYGNETQILLSLVGHGSGWSANVLPGQPSGWGEQPSGWGEQPNDSFSERIGGFLWDDHSGNGDNSRSLSTKGLGQALKWVQNETGRTIDLIYFDACSMGMAEVAYEIRDAASYMLASPNTAWSSFAYEGILNAVDGAKTPKEIGDAWLGAEADVLQGDLYPFTLALYDLGEIDELAEAADRLAAHLIALMQAEKRKMEQAYRETEYYESDYDGAINRGHDTYGDLESFTLRLANGFSGNVQLTDATRDVNAIVRNLIKNTKFQSGQPWNNRENNWVWDLAAGIAIYLPLETNEPKRQLYTATNLAWAADTSWDEFLAEYWGDSVQASGETLLPVCASTRDCATLEQLVEQVKLDVSATPTPTITPVVTPDPTPISTSTPTGTDQPLHIYLPLVTK